MLRVQLLVCSCLLCVTVGVRTFAWLEKDAKRWLLLGVVS